MNLRTLIQTGLRKSDCHAMLSNTAEFLLPCAQGKSGNFLFWRIHSPIKELPSAYYVSDTVLSTEDKAIYKRTKISALWIYILGVVGK